MLSVNEGITSMEPHCQRAISRIVPSEAERGLAHLGSETIERASRCFRADGALLIEDIVDTEQLLLKLEELLIKRIRTIWTALNTRMR